MAAVLPLDGLLRRFAPRNDGEHSAGVLTMSVGWVERFAKPITVVENMMGIASLNPSYAA